MITMKEQKLGGGFRQTTRMGAKHLVIFGYSGTLSLESVLFAEPERLEKELKLSGLHGLGVASPDVFWNKIVDFTWERGSTTGIGYKRLLTERVAALQSEIYDPALGEAIAAAAGCFVDRYLEASRIHEAWHPLLRRIAVDAGMSIVVATDHYAEATREIVGHLKTIGIKARAALEAGSAAFLVANSADLGVPKTDRRFWETVRTAPTLSEVRCVLLIDDFGFNEQAWDSYGARRKVEDREVKPRLFSARSYGLRWRRCRSCWTTRAP